MKNRITWNPLTFPGVIMPFSSASVIILYPILPECDNAKSEGILITHGQGYIISSNIVSMVQAFTRHKIYNTEYLLIQTKMKRYNFHMNHNTAKMSKNLQTCQKQHLYLPKVTHIGQFNNYPYSNKHTCISYILKASSTLKSLGSKWKSLSFHSGNDYYLLNYLIQQQNFEALK